jgi:hypothetical protein
MTRVGGAWYRRGMSNTSLRLAVLLLLVPACGDDGSSSGGSAGTGAAAAGGAGSGAGAGTGAAGVGGEGAAGAGAPSVPTCATPCEVPDDCTTGSLLTDADNWECTGGRCAYLGCSSDAECQQTFGNPDFVCSQAGPLPTCQSTCAAPIDCATATPLTDEDNWDCQANACVYRGCVSDLECQDALQAANYVCADLGGVATCVQTCSAPFDCLTPTPLYDLDNWTCEDDRCVWIGCLSDLECQESLMSPTSVCEGL